MPLTRDDPHERPSPAVWSDAFGRTPRDLRISVTDRCNFRCGYCMPRDKVEKGAFLRRDQILDFEELVRISQIWVGAGVQKIRITGGEPLLRRELGKLVSQLKRLDVEVALTTNGVLLKDQAAALRAAGLDRVTVSLDALDERVFQRSCDAPGFSVQEVLAGIDAADAAGFTNIKVNCVVRRGINDDQVVPLARHFRHTGHTLRFIEFMDVGTRNSWNSSQVVSSADMQQRLLAVGGLEPLPPRHVGEVAERFAWTDGEGEVGFISSVSKPFCGDCSRARLSADGKLFTCLFAQHGVDLLGPIRGGCSDLKLSQLMADTWAQRRDRYSEERRRLPEHRHLPLVTSRVEMSYIGG